MNYRVVYDIATSGYGESELWPGIIAMLVAPLVILVGVVGRQMRIHGARTLIPSGVFAAVWGVCWAGIAFSRHLDGVRKLERGEVAVVQGVVTDFRPQPHGEHKSEQFTVGGKTFHYSEYHMGPGFRVPHERGGPIADGISVRIHFSGEDILRLELAEPAAQ
jgi:hypothetical protein